MRLRTALVLAALGSICGWPIAGAQSPPPSSETETTQQELQRLRARIAALTDQINETRATRDAAAARLRTIEVGLGQVAAESRSLHTKLVEKAEHLEILGRERDEVERIIDGQLADLGRDVRSAHAIGRQDRLKLVLNQENPTHFHGP